jgi:AcrR family transcriptional regulator
MGRIAGVTPEETKDRLIDAAARVFELKGFDGATVALIAREAGVTTGAIYAHYDSKAELLVDALRCHGERATASLFAPGVRVDAATSLVALGERIANRRRPDTSLLSEAILGARRDPELASVLSRTLLDREATLTALFAEGQDDGVLIDELSAEVGARFALMLGLGSMLVSELDLPAVDQAEWTALIRRLVGAFTQEGPE